MTDNAMICLWCEEPVSEGERNPNFREPFHFACGFRSVAGSVAHLEGRCGCFLVGSTEGDPPGMTKREAANAALETAFRIRGEERCARG
jgi:hypothetical protein